MEVAMLLHQKMIVVSVAAAAGLMVAGAAYAHASPQAPSPAAPAGLNLTPAQRDEIRTLREAQRQDAQPLREKMRTARQQLQQAMRADVPDEAAIRSAAGAVAALQADQAVQRARARTQFMSVLTPEQQARMKQARARAAQRAMRAERAMRAQRPPRLMWRQQQLRQDALRRWRGWI
jgi:protein CpxP